MFCKEAAVNNVSQLATTLSQFDNFKKGLVLHIQDGLVRGRHRYSISLQGGVLLIVPGQTSFGLTEEDRNQSPLHGQLLDFGRSQIRAEKIQG